MNLKMNESELYDRVAPRPSRSPKVIEGVSEFFATTNGVPEIIPGVTRNFIRSDM